ncbi:MAG: invasion associated locus B family protein [Hyphomicrobiales bacterium]|nr:invasion associated locus B family protein [Hyphomicrobiales bacterium]
MRLVPLVVPLACLSIGGVAAAQTSFLENLWSSDDGAKAKKTLEPEKPDPWQPVTGGRAKTPETTIEKRKSVAPAPAAKPAPPVAPAKKAAGANWAVSCGPAGAEQAKKICSMVQNIVMAKTKQRLLAVTIRPRAEAGAYALVLSLPHGLYLPAGVQLKVDDKAPVKWMIQTADAKGSYAGGPLGEPLLGALKAGGTLKVSFAAANRKVVSVPVSLSGFTVAFGKLAKAR